MRGILGSTHRETMRDARKLVKNSNLAMHIGSVALAVEALETLLVEKGVLKDNELMTRIEEVSKQYYAKGEFIPPDGN
jgi:hypothetical protein